MIRPFDNCEPPPPVAALSYETVLCTELPAFDPVPTLRSVLLKPPHLQRFECFLRKTGWLTMPIYACGLILRIAVCSVPAPIGRLVSPWAAILHIPPCIVFAAGIRVEFVKLILSAFDFWFPFAANTMFLIVFSCVLRDMRILLVVAVWIAFGCSFLQETYFRDSRNIAMSAFVEASLLILLMGSISLNIMDDLHHSNLLIAGGHTLSTKDVLVNVIGTMATLMMRTTYRRVKLIKRQKQMEGTATQSLGYRCFIALNPTGPGATSRNSVVPHPLVTIFVWYGRLLYILVTRTHENTLIILRGNVEFDYQTWRLQANIAREVRRMAKFAKAAQASKAIVDAIPE
ncbi:hypothetical protein F441_02150 [Phytophthora nicotianae CJ01A1]|uniref:Uncharacterized protein n=2 Tax=Phytophthora nicotianae TaxID=4792 RepID=W2PDB8_PHYN3|nr:hypothetical protein PPTG_19254 [Phytophthora nicotianae INRA-310]ETM98816.1 hypothetical protein PPTG_19254 [Phytophthora nicotianae INRA-310]ETP24940.1 hypothetical protein F441_02150 [Phytophthora nicotianae CJ01A1]